MANDYVCSLLELKLMIKRMVYNSVTKYLSLKQHKKKKQKEKQLQILTSTNSDTLTDKLQETALG